MKTFSKIFQKGAQQAMPINNRIILMRSFVETGDERYPLAGIWSRLPEIDATAEDEPGLAKPVRGVFLLRALLWGPKVFVSSPIHKFAIRY